MTTTHEPADPDGRPGNAHPPAGFPHPTEMAQQRGVQQPPNIPAQRSAPYQQPIGAYQGFAPPMMATGASEPSLLRRHLGAMLIAATILLVGAGGIITWAATSGSTTGAAPAPSSSSSQTSSSGTDGSSTSTGSTLSSTDQRFVSVLQNGGLPITSVNQQDFITVGHNVCGMLAQGYTLPPMITYLTSQKGYSSSEAATFVGASIGAYCPQYSPTGGAG